MIRVTLHQPIKPIVDPEHFDAGQTSSNGSGTNDTVDSGCGTTSRKYCDTFQPVHAGAEGNIVRE